MAAELAAFKASQRAEDIPALCAAINGVGAPAEREELWDRFFPELNEYAGDELMCPKLVNDGVL